MPLLIFIGIFAWAALGLRRASTRTPADALPVYVVAKQWMWKLQHPNGRREINELHVPLGQPVRLVMTSQDVIHSFYVPAFRLKQDVRAGPLHDAVVHGDAARRLPPVLRRVLRHRPLGDARPRRRDAAGRLRALARRRPATSRASRSAASRSSAATAAAAATTPARRVHAPPLDGLLGRTVHLQDGRSVVADEDYMRDSILLPQKDVVAGYAPIMPSFAGQLDEEDIAALVAYIALDRRQARRRTAMTAPRDAELPRRRLHAALVARPRTTTSASRSSTRLDHRLLLHRRRRGDADPARARDARGRPGLARHLQQALHRARRDHGVALPDPVDPVGARQLPAAADDRRARPRLPAPEPAELVPLHRRRRCSRWRRCCSAASTPAGPSTRRSRRCSRTATWC